MNINYIFELPLYEEPTGNVLRMMKDLSSSSVRLCEMTFHRKMLSFLIQEISEEGNIDPRRINFIPFSKNTTLEDVNRFTSMVSKFVSLFHCSLVAQENERKISFELSFDEKCIEKYGKNAKAVFRITTTPLTESANKSYNCLFPYIDLDNEVLHVEHHN